MHHFFRIPPVSHRRRGAAVILTVFVLACTEGAGPTTPDDNRVSGPQSYAAANMPRGIHDEFLRIAEQIPGFAGFYRNEQGDIVVRIVSPAGAPQARAAVDAYRTRHQALKTRHDGAASSIIVAGADYAFSDLHAWKERLRQSGPRGMGIHVFAADEYRNKVYIGIQDVSTQADVLASAVRLGIPENAIHIEWLPGQATLGASVRDRIRPTVGGLQIARPVFGGTQFCSIGLHVRDSNGTPYAITASHCTGDFSGGALNQAWFQPTNQTWGQVAVNPAWSTTGCAPDASRCINADAAAIAYASGVTGDPALVQTSSVGEYGPGNTTIYVRLNTAAPSAALVGDTVFKTGRTSGSTKGRVALNCADILFQGGLEVRCLTVATTWSDEGDSGGVVYLKWAPPLGIYWRAPAGTVVGHFHPSNHVELPRMYFNPWDRVEAVLGLGSLTTQ